MRSIFRLSVLTFACLLSIDDTAQQSSYKITTKRDNDQMKVVAEKDAEKDKVTFVVKSPFGISNATFERNTSHWPERVAIRFHLSGLEHFEISTSKTKLESAASLQDGKLQLRTWKDGKEEEPLTPKSPFWLDIQILDRESKPAKSIPLQDGTFEIQLPKALFDHNPTKIYVSWIDFHR